MTGTVTGKPALFLHLSESFVQNTNLQTKLPTHMANQRVPSLPQRRYETLSHSSRDSKHNLKYTLCSVKLPSSVTTGQKAAEALAGRIWHQ